MAGHVPFSGARKLMRELIAGRVPMEAIQNPLPGGVNPGHLIR
jgi:hypothetical protein